ncbi:lipocalin family protein [Stenotrophomonas sp. Iso1]|uniref:lipocalin family protein n=1 Tax=Stenotrophomonas sp. Iso1 TaxID=2977283 RepID=UPI0022B79B3D|nr:lipocalin family protein [Stenotrophomonas sp. Iso1]
MRPIPAFLSALLLSLTLPLVPAHAQEAPAATPIVEGDSEGPVDLQRFMGRWYVIGRVPNFVERGHVASVNTYALREDDKVAINYQFREGFGEPTEALNIRAKVDEDSGNRRWRTWFYRVVPTHSRILEVAPDYSWALIGYPGREMAWIFAREPDMDNTLYRHLALRLRDKYDVNTDKLKRVPQHPEQVGRLGFEVPNKK